MTSTAQPGQTAISGAASAPGLGAALDQLWTRFLPEIRARVNLLETAAAACAANRSTVEEREAAHAAAHKLAGTLGTFSLAHGTELAREFELAILREDAPDPALAGRLTSIATGLRAIVESRK